MKFALLKIFFLCFCTTLFSQNAQSQNYPQGYFRNPLNIPISLAANFGELRKDHFHMGLDIRTQKRENLPVYASAEGYISRIKIEPQGYGQAIYIRHPNGYTTLYAHLNGFTPRLATFIKQQQYEKQSWELSLEIAPGLFPVSQGDLIAFSGNTGGSQGPHLHFEIRKTEGDVNLNPLLFGLPVDDKRPPTILRLAVYDRTKSIYEQSPRMMQVQKSSDRFSIPGGIITVISPRIGFAISAFDTQTGSNNPNGIYEASLYANNQRVISFRTDSISYNNTRNINAHIDYKTKANGGPYLQELFRLPGYLHSVYQAFQGDGTIDVSDGLVHSLRIEVKDVAGNHSDLDFKVQYHPSPGYNLNFPGKEFYPMMLDGYETEDCSFYIGESCLYDSVHIRYSKSLSLDPQAVSLVHSIGDEDIPLGDFFLLRIKPKAGLAVGNYDKIVMERISGKSYEVQKPEWLAGWASARFRDFGNYQLVLDEEPPLIIPIGISEGANLRKSLRIAFIIKDNLNSYKNFRAELDGNWLLFTNDKAKAFTYKFDEHCPSGKHELKISVEDQAGNKTAKIFHFNR